MHRRLGQIVRANLFLRLWCCAENAISDLWQTNPCAPESVPNDVLS